MQIIHEAAIYDEADALHCPPLPETNRLHLWLVIVWRAGQHEFIQFAARESTIRAKCSGLGQTDKLRVALDDAARRWHRYRVNSCLAADCRCVFGFHLPVSYDKGG